MHMSAPEADTPMIYFLRRGAGRLASETRLNPLGPGYELVVTMDGVTRVEPFEDLAGLLSREHELIQAWRATGWRETATPPPADPVHVPSVEEDWLSARR
jgi:hypothetical protein